jgi:integrase
VREVLDRQERRSPVIVLGERGRPFQTTSGFRARFFKLIRELKKCELVAEGLTFHGLRHSMGTWLADHGANIREIGAVLGHRTDAMAAHYSRRADKRRAASSAIERLERKSDDLAKPVR